MTEVNQLFSNKVSEYVKYRPSYPQEMVDVLSDYCSLHGDSSIADIGSGTGIFSQLLLSKGFDVFGIEPNDEMRTASDHLLDGFDRFRSIKGFAEDTKLPSNSVDLITSAQAFHWFKGEETKQEFRRILKNDGFVALIWNQRDSVKPIHQDINEILNVYAPGHIGHAHYETDDQRITEFFEPNGVKTCRMEHSQEFTLEEFIGRLKSASYCPPPDSNELHFFVKELTDLFMQYSVEKKITFPYQTKLFVSSL